MKLLTLFAVSLFTAAFAAPKATTLDAKQLQPFLENYCIKCHGPKKQKGQVRFDQTDWKITDNDTAQRWQDVLDQLNGGDMPPEDEKQPSNAEMAAALDSITGSVITARKRLTDHGGKIKMRRLNKREYAATIRDIFGFDVSLHDIPEDGEITTFDTVGEEQFFNSAHFEKYLELGRQVADTAFRYNTSPRRKVTKSRTETEDRVTKRMRKDLAEKDRKKALLDAGKTWKEAGFKDEGEMKILLSQWDSRAELPRSYLKYPHVNTGVYNSNVAKWSYANKHIDIRGDYLIRVHGGLVDNPHELRKFIRLSDGDRIHGTLKMTGTPENPESVVLRTRQPMGRTQLAIRLRENFPDHAINSTRGYINQLKDPRKHPDPRPSLWFDWIEIEGPFYPEKRPAFEELLYPGIETGKNGPYLNHDKSAHEFLEKFSTLAFRRKAPEPAYLEALHQNFVDLRASGKNYREAMTEVMAIVLASPSFLFIQEAAPEQDKPHGLLDNRELAIRLSYFLWSSPPDNELYDADLSDPEIYSQQIDRLLADPKSQAFRDGFIGQWTHLDRYDAITIDTRQHPHFNEGLQRDAKQEVREFFSTLIKENLPVKNLIDSEFVTINGALANHYGLPFNNPRDASFRKIKLPAGSHRGGLLTQAAFLVTGSNGERSSPVIRGALVMEKILHDAPAPPPPNVPELDEASDKPMTNREMVLLHQDRATCASCHKKMDVIGFGLENFDPTGRWRVTEKVGRKQVPIQPGGTLPGGGEFKDVTELKKLLLLHQDKLAHELTESILAYALGRTVEFSDDDDVEEILSKLKPQNYPLRTLIREVALSPLFKKK
ncbi:DUF1592 domain-containing protein [Akkermansiaceae bacterium]|nr:DUF1592 domain-containing protein [Akkermansiaceae bacterium]